MFWQGRGAGEVAWEVQSRSALLNVRSIFSFPVSLGNLLATVLALRCSPSAFLSPSHYCLGNEFCCETTYRVRVSMGMRGGREDVTRDGVGPRVREVRARQGRTTIRRSHKTHVFPRGLRHPRTRAIRSLFPTHSRRSPSRRTHHGEVREVDSVPRDGRYVFTDRVIDLAADTLPAGCRRSV